MLHNLITSVPSKEPSNSQQYITCDFSLVRIMHWYHILAFEI